MGWGAITGASQVKQTTPDLQNEFEPRFDRGKSGAGNPPRASDHRPSHAAETPTAAAPPAPRAPPRPERSVAMDHVTADDARRLLALFAPFAPCGSANGGSGGGPGAAAGARLERLAGAPPAPCGGGQPARCPPHAIRCPCP
jgi:hypothetical protein